MEEIGVDQLKDSYESLLELVRRVVYEANRDDTYGVVVMQTELLPDRTTRSLFEAQVTDGKSVFEAQHGERVFGPSDEETTKNFREKLPMYMIDEFRWPGEEASPIFMQDHLDICEYTAKTIESEEQGPRTEYHGIIISLSVVRHDRHDVYHQATITVIERMPPEEDVKNGIENMKISE